MRPALIATLLAFTACTPQVTTLPPLDSGKPRAAAMPSAPDTCGAVGLQVLVGQDVALFESQQRVGPSRILRPGQAVTSDYSETRVNVAVDKQNRITRITCG